MKVIEKDDHVLTDDCEIKRVYWVYDGGRRIKIPGRKESITRDISSKNLINVSGPLNIGVESPFDVEPLVRRANKAGWLDTSFSNMEDWAYSRYVARFEPRGRKEIHVEPEEADLMYPSDSDKVHKYLEYHEGSVDEDNADENRDVIENIKEARQIIRNDFENIDSLIKASNLLGESLENLTDEDYGETIIYD